MEENFPEKEHIKPFLAHLGSADHINALRKFCRTFDALHDGTNKYYLDACIRGITVQLYYQNGKLTSAITKGDGIRGLDITPLAEQVPNIASYITTKVNLVVRGTLTIYRDDLYTLNQLRECNGLEPYYDPKEYLRHVLCHDIQSDKCAFRFYAWELVPLQAIEFDCEEQRDKLIALGFSIPKNQVLSDIDEMNAYIDTLALNRRELPYIITGVVIKQNDASLREKAGVVDGEDSSRCIWHFNKDGVVITLAEVEWRVDRTGYLTPYGKFKKTNLNGREFRYINLGNLAYMRDNHLGVGSKLRVKLSGDSLVIADILRSGNTEFPTVCPVCGEAVEEANNGLYCRNPSCPEVLEGSLNYFIHDSLEYNAFTSEMIHEAVVSKTITSLKDVFAPIINKSEKLTQASLDDLVVAMRSVNMVDLISSLGIPGMGRAIANKISVEAAGRIAGLIKIMTDEEYFTYLPISKYPKEALRAWVMVPSHQQFLHDLESLSLPNLH